MAWGTCRRGSSGLFREIHGSSSGANIIILLADFPNVRQGLWVRPRTGAPSALPPSLHSAVGLRAASLHSF